VIWDQSHFLHALREFESFYNRAEAVGIAESDLVVPDHPLTVSIKGSAARYGGHCSADPLIIRRDGSRRIAPAETLFALVGVGVGAIGELGPVACAALSRLVTAAAL
jgi:hypothetical protein